MESGQPNDYTIYELRSYSFARAEKIANQRLHRLEEFKAIVGQIGSDEGYKELIKLRKNIIGSHSIEVDSGKVAKMSEEDKKKHNQQTAQGVMNFINN